MPQATSFQALGAGNGFPFCPDKVRVDTFDYWTTLGGYSKDASDASTAVTAEQIHESRVNAMKLYWSLHLVRGVHDRDGTSTTETIDADNDIHDNFFWLEGIAEPRERICDIKDDVGDSTGDYGLWMDNTPPSALGNALVSKFWGNCGSIVRMYDGVATDEDNFVGFGIKSDVATFYGDYDIAGINYSYYAGSFAEYAAVYCCSYGDSISGLSLVETDDYAYTTIQGIPVLCVAIAASTSVDSPSPVADAANLKATCYEGDPTTNEPVYVDLKHAGSDSLEFYDYP